MLRRLFSFLRGGPRTVDQVLPFPDGKRIYREFHKLRKEQMDPDAIKVINRLSRHGYRSYLVGGCVRDMVLGKKPKDFDVVTQATPSQIRRIFANSRSIGRRFKIVHVVFRGGKVVEVSTFRGLPEHRLEKNKNKSRNQDLLMQKDNIFGTPKEDAARRDFTINALYFDPRNESIIDYVGGYEDIQSRKLRVIGDADVSFSEDPVRMLRAAKFAALHGFTIEPETARAIRRKRDEILKASSARMLEEYYKIFRTGKTSEIFGSFAETGLLQVLFPEAGKLDGAEFKESRLGKRLEFADRILTEREDLTTTIYLALLISEAVPRVFDGELKQNIVEYVKAGIHPVCQRMNIPGKERDRIMHIFISQHRFRKTESGARPDIFRNKIFFYEAFLVFKIHSVANQDEESIQRAMFWEFGPKVFPPEGSQVITFFPARRRQRDFRDDRGDRGDRDRGSNDRNDRNDRNERNDRRPRRPGKRPDRNKGPRTDRPNDRPDRSDRNDRNDRNDRMDRPDRSQDARPPRNPEQSENAEVDENRLTEKLENGSSAQAEGATPEQSERARKRQDRRRRFRRRRREQFKSENSVNGENSGAPESSESQSSSQSDKPEKPAQEGKPTD